MSFLGHRDSKMIHHYYHLRQDEARHQMAKLRILDNQPKTLDLEGGGTRSTPRRLEFGPTGEKWREDAARLATAADDRENASNGCFKASCPGPW